MSDIDRERNLTLNPKFDDKGLITAVISDADTHEILMIGHMNKQALEQSLSSGIVHFFSRTRQKLWKKGETSGNILNIEDMRIDCDQDAIWIIAKAEGPTCHTGVKSCFYRRITDIGLEKL